MKHSPPALATDGLESSSVTQPVKPTKGAQPYMLESDGFYEMISTQRTMALTARDLIDNELHRLEAEIQQRMERRGDLDQIIAASEAALSLRPRAAPKVIEQSQDGEQDETRE